MSFDALMVKLVKMRESARRKLKGKTREQYHCPHCWEVRAKKVKGVEKSIKSTSSKYVVSFQCPKCEKEWKGYYIKQGKWQNAYKKFKSNVLKFKRGKKKFLSLR